MEYHFIKVDCEGPNLYTLAAKYKALRLEALRQSPTSFSSTIETESQFSDEVWVSRLQTPDKENFVCVATAEDGQSEWVAQVTLRGPVSAKEFLPPIESGQPNPASDEEAEKWQMLSLYTLPSHRGMKLGSRLCEKAFEFLRSRNGTGTPQIVVRIMVKPENVATLRLYDGLGFERAGYCTLEEALRANGDTDLIPRETLDDQYTTRSGIVMLLHLARANIKMVGIFRYSLTLIIPRIVRDDTQMLPRSFLAVSTTPWATVTPSWSTSIRPYLTVVETARVNPDWRVETCNPLEAEMLVRGVIIKEVLESPVRWLRPDSAGYGPEKCVFA
ncbi:hypothetical protein V496_09297 [Pseudogymnoascus sp. VKM F-4515 (FW-2607)]|nr:hypothetical protein V496_09297 [Pseudogymnoascus sp. VKM F-4515 (FW-2607)]